MTELSGMTASEAIAASDGVRARSGAAASRRAQEHPQSPEELDRAAWHDVRLIACAILAEREASEKRMGELLKDPAAVRVNFLRGSIACQPLIDEAISAERERCAGYHDDLAAQHEAFAEGSPMEASKHHKKMARRHQHYAAAIRKGES
ncbi:MAG: hypothetical protein IT554_03345 [Sphingomonadaceae bacterium]|jgi:hypothetical protein|nr:hypothetical protein [Sphingomonadaceae bacterium]